MSSQLEILSNKFNNLLTQYKDTYKQFIDTINSNNNTFTSLPKSAFIGTVNLNTIKNTSINSCITACSSNYSCSGATFDNKLNSCNLKSGNGNIIKSRNQTAIIKQALFYSYKLQNINNELINVNNSMMSLANSNKNSYEYTQNLNREKSEILQKNYNTLTQERGDIQQIINEYETLNSAYDNVNINLTANYYSYVIYVLITIFLVFLFLRFSTSNEQLGGSSVKFGRYTPFILVSLIIIIIINSSLNN